MVSPDEGIEPSPSSEPEGLEGSAFGGLVDDLFTDQDSSSEAPAPLVAATTSRQYRPKGLFLGTRRDTGAPIDIKPQVLARHGAMLGSTGSGKTVMAKALIEEAALAGIPSLIIDPQGDLARLALGIDLSLIHI